MAPADAIDLDSTAVLAFDDGTRLPCDRFIMRLFCSVVKSVLETVDCATDERRRTVVPIPGQGPAPFRVALEVLHGTRSAWDLGLDEVVGAARCMEFLGSTAHDTSLDARLWCLIKDGELADMAEHLPRLLRAPLMAALVVRRLIQLRPLWLEFYVDVLQFLRPCADRQVVDAIVAYASNFFPPALVVDWALDALMTARAGEPPPVDAILAAASLHGVMCHPIEMSAILRRVARLGQACAWPGALPAFLKNAVASLENFQALPWSPTKSPGTIIKFHDVPTVSVCVALERLPSAPVRVTPWLKLCFHQDGGMEVAFKPSRMDDDVPRRCRTVQLRVMCTDRADYPQGLVAEAWHLFDARSHVAALADGDGDTYTLPHATATMGDMADVARLLRLRAARNLRLDFFYGAVSVLDNPFDPSVSTRGAGAATNILWP